MYGKLRLGIRGRGYRKRQGLLFLRGELDLSAVLPDLAITVLGLGIRSAGAGLDV